MLLAFTEARAVRMIVALLAASDPLGRIDDGHRPAAYEPVAAQVFDALRDGDRGTAVIEIIAAQAPAGALTPLQYRATHAFLAAALDWWASSERLLTVEDLAS